MTNASLCGVVEAARQEGDRNVAFVRGESERALAAAREWWHADFMIDEAAEDPWVAVPRILDQLRPLLRGA